MASELAWRMQEDGYLMKINDLEDDNRKLFALLKHESKQTEKLRELVRDMYHVIATLEEANDEAVVRDGVMLDAEHFAKRMRELGVDG